MVVPHETYVRLGGSRDERAARYRELFRAELDPGLIDQIRTATNRNYALGSDRFAAEVGAMLGRRVTPGKSGRPPKEAAVESTRELF